MAFLFGTIDATHFYVKIDNMYKAQMFQETLSAVIEETEIDRERILSGCKQEEVVDARALLVKVMSERGLYPAQISSLTGIGLRSITKFLLCFGVRVNSRKILRINYERVRNKLGMP